MITPWRPLGAALCVLWCSSSAVGQTQPSAPPQTQPSADPVLGARKPQWPLKTKRTLLTDAQIAEIRARCAKDKQAAEFKQSVLEQAAYWAGQSDEHLRALLPDSRVPRALDVSAKGCPVHGAAIYQFGTYPWKLERDHPFKVTCPVGGESYPSNDFSAYYDSGFRDRSTLTGDHADAGRGWIAPDGEKYWFVGYACHWQWSQHWMPAVRFLSQAYVLTGDVNYAHKALVMLDRIAEVYPGMDLNSQSRLGELQGGYYAGKIQNSVFEAWLFDGCVLAYDRVFDVLTGPQPMNLPWRSAPDIQANIEANYIEEGIDAIHKSQIQGGHGNDLGTLLYALIVRQQGPIPETLQWVFSGMNAENYRQGINYALYNLILKDGMPYETSPFYCFNWVNSYVATARALSFLHIDLYQHPKMSLMFAAPLKLICTGQFTPNLGDAGSFDAGWIGPTVEAYEAAYRHYPESQYAWAFHHLGGLDHRPQAVEDLLDPPLVSDPRFSKDVDRCSGRLPSRFLDGCGIAILNNPKDSLAVSAFYGIPSGHGHQDQLNIELFGYGHRLSPDLGYPDSMNAFVPGIYSWSRHTISHNCLSLDRSPQTERRKGRLLRFHDSPTVRLVDLDVAGVYPQAQVYRRTLVQVDVSDEASYLIDVMRCQGGQDQVLSIHGGEGSFSWSGPALSPPETRGTLAGPNVAYGVMYDDPVLSQPGYHGHYDIYRGSGYQHFFNWQKAAVAQWTSGTWLLDEKAGIGLCVHTAPAVGQEMIVADAFVSPTRKVPATLKYMLAHREAGPSGQTFVTLWEPFRGKPLIDRIESGEPLEVPAAADATITLSVHRGTVVDHIAVTPAPGTPFAHRAGISGDSVVTVATVTDDGQVSRAFAAAGRQVKLPGGAAALSIRPTMRGLITRVDYAQRTLRVEPTVVCPPPSLLVNHCVRIFNELHSCAYIVENAEVTPEALLLRLSGSDVYTGRIKLDRFGPEANTIRTSTKILYPFDIKGMRLLNDTTDVACLIRSMDQDAIKLQTSPDQIRLREMVGRDLMIADFGVGDQIEIELSAQMP